jgi:hypothetical protein
MADAYTDTIYLVGDSGGDPLTVRPHSDDPGQYVQVVAEGRMARQYWGKVDLVLPKAVAVELGRALVKCGGAE